MIRLLSCCFIAILALTSVSLAQLEEPAIKIDSPRDGTVVHPGDTIIVVVSAVSKAAGNAVFILGEGPIASDPSPLPARIPLSIPRDLKLGRHIITAIDRPPVGNRQFPSIELDVELPDSTADAAGTPAAPVLEKIKSSSPSMVFESQGEEEWLMVRADYPDGREVDITESSRLVYRSSDPKTATVNSWGMVKAIAPGKCLINIAYIEGGRSLRTSVEVTVEGGVVNAMPSSLDFGRIALGAGTSRQIVFTYATTNPAVRITDVEITGNFSQTNDCLSTSVERTEKQCTVVVTFSPKAAGERRGALSVRDSFRAAPATIPLIGFGDR